MSATPPMLVSIITPVYNGAKFLEELIQSVKDQDYPQIEHIVVDDGSDDGGATLAILHKYPHLRWWSRENRGQYATMNEGLASAHGDLICFISADDECTPGAVTAVVQYLLAHAGADGVYGRCQYVDEDGGAYPVQEPFRPCLRCYRYFPNVDHRSVYIRKATLEEHYLFFDPTLRYNGDFDWLMRAAEAKLRLGFLNRELSRGRVHPAQASERLEESIWAERKTVLERHRVSRVLFQVLMAARTAYWLIRLSAHAFQTGGFAGLKSRIDGWAKRRFGRRRRPEK